MCPAGIGWLSLYFCWGTHLHRAGKLISPNSFRRKWGLSLFPLSIWRKGVHTPEVRGLGGTKRGQVAEREGSVSITKRMELGWGRNGMPAFKANRTYWHLSSRLQRPEHSEREREGLGRILLLRSDSMANSYFPFFHLIWSKKPNNTLSPPRLQLQSSSKVMYKVTLHGHVQNTVQ